MIVSRRVALTTALGPLLTVRTTFGATVPQGLWPVMLTPFQEDRSVDWTALDALTDWYLENGADGLFACCQSSEVWQLTEEERLEITARVVKRSGKTPVVAGGIPGFAPKAVAEFVSQLAERGARAAILTTCQIAEQQDEDSLWRQRVESILTSATSLPFGLYEAPSPYKRLLTADTMRWAASTQRFVFHKDTSCEIGAVGGESQSDRGYSASPLQCACAHSHRGDAQRCARIQRHRGQCVSESRVIRGASSVGPAAKGCFYSGIPHSQRACPERQLSHVGQDAGRPRRRSHQAGLPAKYPPIQTGAIGQTSGASQICRLPT